MAGLRLRASIRRFDVFTGYQRQQARADGMPPDEAVGYALWAAKVFASRKFAGSLFKLPLSQAREQVAQQEGRPNEGTGRAESKRLGGS